MADYEQMILKYGVGKAIIYKEMFIPKAELQSELSSCWYP